MNSVSSTQDPWPENPEIRAFLFDLDGVLTPTLEIHIQAWKETFDDYLVPRDLQPFTLDEYYRFVDGRRRYDGVQALLASRGIELAWGSESDAELTTVCGIGNAKNKTFQSVLKRDGIKPYPGSLKFLKMLHNSSVAVAVVSSSQNATAVLQAAGIADFFQIVVDGNVARQQNLAGKPHPDTYLYAAKQLRVQPEHAAVVEDALSGVAAGQAGKFSMVIGVDRGSGEQALRDAGADSVVTDLEDLII
jgi:beta-phosphoglucomutase family hydrolase